MKCPECEKAGIKSRVYPGVGYTTLMYCPSFYDEEGKYHHHDMNSTTTQYRCSNAHEWSETFYGSCWCGWGKATVTKTDDSLKIEDSGTVGIMGNSSPSERLDISE